MLVISKVRSHLLNDYSTEAMTNENQWPMFSFSLLLLLRFMGVPVARTNVTFLR